ncbi:DMT family transporter [Actinomadura sp. DC4]|uniref:DMT family transporter n=1 Tax=Actinomadura sp. DC4 TaxID=3055069 RepID=UPI0025AEF4B1|nr:DMT family transporter [Actinomadura sp. DC4]MDN3352030.1 DMT family transporter [Actinomadura sp. DC4]
MTIEPAPSRRTRTLPLVAILVTVLLWASAFVAIRRVGRDLSAGELSLGRLLVGSAVLGAVVLARRGKGAVPPIRWSAWPRLVTCGVLWFGLYNVTLNEAERHVDAGTAAMLVNIGPLLVAVLAGAVLREGFPRPLVGGLLISFAGVVVIGMSSSSGGRADAWGSVLCVVAAVAYAISVVVQKPLLRDASALHVTWLSCTIGAVVCLPYGPGLAGDLSDARPQTVALVVYLGVMPTALAFTTWAYALARSSAGRLGTTTYLVPPIAILLGWTLLGEVPALPALGGGLLCLVGVYLSRRPAETRAAEEPASPAEVTRAGRAP